MKEKYFDIMEKVLSAYTNEHIQHYFNDVKQNGLKEHGFPRLTANIGILIAHGHRTDLLPIFVEMMEFCCKTIPNVKAANDFSVREIICCLLEVEQSKILPKEKTDLWRDYLAKIEPTACYNIFATSPTDKSNNWALFTAVSEYFRQDAGLCHSEEFIDLQLQQQLCWLDENGMYMDRRTTDIHNPIVYDLVPRGLFSLLLERGYKGKYFSIIDENLKKAALMTLDMQSPNGEIPFGGRSNQFLHNEAWMIAIFEYEAKRYTRKGDLELADRFKSAAVHALNVTVSWLAKEPIRHIKNRFPTETKYGCEDYAYFDKYMITVASIIYVAYLICDDTIPFNEKSNRNKCILQTSKHFHKLFMKSDSYCLEFDLNADPHYDANGLGRVHRDGAPSAICLSCPCPSSPKYVINSENPIAASICSAIKQAGEWHLGAEEGTIYNVVHLAEEESGAFADLICKFKNGVEIKEHYSVNNDGVSITANGKEDVYMALPVFYFDGEEHPKITVCHDSISITYDGWICKYKTNGHIINANSLANNRNGYYKIFVAEAKEKLDIKIVIERL